MKKWAIIVLFLIFSCSTINDNKLNYPKLTIVNQTSSALVYLNWHDNSGNIHYYVSDKNIYYVITENSNTYGMRSGNSDWSYLNTGTGRVYFNYSWDITNTNRQYYTVETYNLTNGGTYTIILSDSTLISN